MEKNKEYKAICLEETCHKQHNEEYSRYYCSEECKERSNARDYLEVMADDAVTCPYCKEDQTDIGDGGGYYDAQGDEFECQFCGREFILYAEQYTRFTSHPTEEEVDIYLEAQS